jgi:hypothetical protein
MKTPLEISEEVREASRYEDEPQIDPIELSLKLIIIGLIIKEGLEIAARTPWIQRLFTPN